MDRINGQEIVTCNVCGVLLLKNMATKVESHEGWENRRPVWVEYYYCCQHTQPYDMIDSYGHFFKKMVEVDGKGKYK